MKIAFLSGGTFGHIGVALTLAKNFPKNNVFFIIDKRSIKYFKNNSFKKYIIECYGLNKQFFLKPFRFASNIIAIKKIKKIYKENQIDTIFGVGGYISYLGVLAASRSMKVYIHEQNSVLGLANKLSMKKANKIFLSFPITKYLSAKKIITTGNPRFDECKSLCKHNLILITSGSQGSKVINEKSTELLNNHKLDYRIIFVTGQKYYNDVRSKLNNLNQVYVYPYIDNLVDLVSLSKIIICRAGSGTLFEVLGCKCVPIIIPSPNVTNNHQLLNALYFLKQYTGIIIEEKNLTGNKLYSSIEEIDNEYYKYMKIIDKSNNHVSPTQIILKEIANG